MRALLPVLLLLPAPAAAQELLLNRSFEPPDSPSAPIAGNNFYPDIARWAVRDITPAPPNGNAVNLIRPNGNYGGGPNTPPTGGGTQYFDVNSAAGALRQQVTVPGRGMVDIGGFFSARDGGQAIAAGSLQINLRRGGTVDAPGTIVRSLATASFATGDGEEVWKEMSALRVPVEAGTYIFEVVLPNPANFDLATMFFRPGLTATKASRPVGDGVNTAVNAKLIPGAVVEYTITATNPSSTSSGNDYALDAASLALVDRTPAGTAFMLNWLTGGPVAFAPGASGTTLTYTSPANALDDVDFSADGGATWTYVPVAAADGTDARVTHVRLRPQGAMAASRTGAVSSFSVQLRYRIR